MKNVVVLGYGSIGKRHVKNLIALGITPYVVTKYPDEQNAYFVNKISDCKNIEYALIASPTSRHLDDFSAICKTNCKKVLIEKPLELSVERAIDIRKLAEAKKISVKVGYNLRFLNIFNILQDIIIKNIDEIRLVKIYAGQYLPEWRPYKNYKESYSSHRQQGGGVDLDLSHEIDYLVWLFGKPLNIDFVKRYNISKLEIDAPDFFKALYKYENFIIDIELDYFRKKERGIRIIGENKSIVEVDLINKNLIIDGIVSDDMDYFNFEETYILELKEFLEINNKSRLTSIEEAIVVMDLLKLEL